MTKQDITRIYIPTYGRSTVRTYENLPVQLQRRAVLVVNYEGMRELRGVYPDAQFLNTPYQGKGGPTIKQYLVDRAKSDGTKTLIIADDDLAFKQASWSGDRKKFRQATSKQIAQFFDRCETVCQSEGIGAVGPSVPYFNDTKEPWINNRRICYLIFANMEAVKESNARFDALPTMGDVWFNLCLAEWGYQTRLDANMSVLDLSTRGKGGENAVPTMTWVGVNETNRHLPDRKARQILAMQLLHKRWPKYVKFRETKGNARHAQNIGTSQDITILFSSAVKDGLRTMYGVRE